MRSTAIYNDLFDYEVAYQALEHLTVSRVVHYMQYTLCGGGHEIYCSGQQTTPIELAKSNVAGCLANRVKIYFWGGPPDKVDWFEGTLLTMLLDRLWYAITIGYHADIDKFLEALNANHN